MDTVTPELKARGERLASFLKDRSIPQTDFAPRVGVKQASLSKICRGVIRPSLDTAVAIERETHGEIPASWWAIEPAE